MNLEIFNLKFENTTFRVVSVNDHPWFFAQDVLKFCGYETSEAIEIYCTSRAKLENYFNIDDSHIFKGAIIINLFDFFRLWYGHNKLGLIIPLKILDKMITEEASPKEIEEIFKRNLLQEQKSKAKAMDENYTRESFNKLIR